MDWLSTSLGLELVCQKPHSDVNNHQTLKNKHAPRSLTSSDGDGQTDQEAFDARVVDSAEASASALEAESAQDAGMENAEKGEETMAMPENSVGGDWHAAQSLHEASDDEVDALVAVQSWGDMPNINSSDDSDVGSDESDTLAATDELLHILSSQEDTMTPTAIDDMDISQDVPTANFSTAVTDLFGNLLQMREELEASTAEELKNVKIKVVGDDPAATAADQAAREADAELLEKAEAEKQRQRNLRTVAKASMTAEERRNQRVLRAKCTALKSKTEQLLAAGMLPDPSARELALKLLEGGDLMKAEVAFLESLAELKATPVDAPSEQQQTQDETLNIHTDTSVATEPYNTETEAASTNNEDKARDSAVLDGEETASEEGRSTNGERVAAQATAEDAFSGMEPVEQQLPSLVVREPGGRDVQQREAAEAKERNDDGTIDQMQKAKNAANPTAAHVENTESERQQSTATSVTDADDSKSEAAAATPLQRRKLADQAAGGSGAGNAAPAMPPGLS
eukprot:SAG31_NODE_6370_length_2041_cov_3.242533_1_plen_512_part_01